MTVAEVSGDQHASALIRSLLSIDPTLEISALGGPLMREAGAHLFQETTRRAAMGLAGALRAFEVWKMLRWTKQHFQESRPDVLVCVDSPAMNFHFAHLAHDMGIPVVQYVAPQLWAWREGRMKKVRKWIDRLCCILPFEEAYFRRHGVNATFVGHPLFDELPARSPTRPMQSIGPNGPVVGLLPGSRAGEAKANFPGLLAAGRLIAVQFPNIRFHIPTTPATDPIVREMAGGDSSLNIGLNLFDTLVPACDLCLTVSGTATLHVAAHGVPMIVVYRMGWLIKQLLRPIVKTRTFALVNLLADPNRHIVPELIPWNGDAGALARLAIEFLKDDNKRDQQRGALAKLVETLDRPGASMNVARIVLETANSR